ncbi:MAG: aldehyde dehydrogenase family protein, partial [Pseudomonadales bacterium]|nr:aldehyde dehydrogenase family protein [Pseudomonadales bacterium]
MGISEKLVSDDSECQIDELTFRFQQQRLAYLSHPEVDYRDRIRQLKLLRKMLIKHRRDIKLAINADYGNRSDVETFFAEIATVILSINHMIHNLKNWMKPRKRKVGIAFVGGKSEVVPQALGVVGIIVPWNFPVYLSFIPIATALAAGNRVMVKMSDRSSNLAKFLVQVSSQYLPSDTLSFIEETGRVGERFSLLPFDLLLFTGSSNTGKSVMKSAANNLTPVILELGGKNPVIIDPSFPLEKAVERIIFAKHTNAGQV